MRASGWHGRTPYPEEVSFWAIGIGNKSNPLLSAHVRRGAVKILGRLACVRRGAAWRLAVQPPLIVHILINPLSCKLRSARKHCKHLHKAVKVKTRSRGARHLKMHVVPGT